MSLALAISICLTPRIPVDDSVVPADAILNVSGEPVLNTSAEYITNDD